MQCNNFNLRAWVHVKLVNFNENRRDAAAVIVLPLAATVDSVNERCIIASRFSGDNLSH